MKNKTHTVNSSNIYYIYQLDRELVTGLTFINFQ